MRLSGYKQRSRKPPRPPSRWSNTHYFAIQETFTHFFIFFVYTSFYFYNITACILVAHLINRDGRNIMTMLQKPMLQCSKSKINFLTPLLPFYFDITSSTALSTLLLLITSGALPLLLLLILLLLLFIFRRLMPLLFPVLVRAGYWLV